MNRSLSVYFELARFTATAIVLLGHGKIFYQPLAEFCEWTNPGRDAVIIFFVLSGYVISWCASERDHALARFCVNRAARVYSVALPAVALGLFVSVLASWHQARALDYPFHKLWLYLPMYLSFSGNLWSLNETPPSNFPFWSLNYEVWYYALFAAAFFLRGAWRWLVLAVVLATAGPAILSLLPLWLTGSVLYFNRHRLALPATLARWLIAATIAGYLALKAFSVDDWIDAAGARWYLVHFGGVLKDKLLGDYLVGVLVALNFVAAANAQLNFSARAARWASALASCSFSAYLFHVPIFELVKLIYGGQDSLLAYVGIMLASCALVILLARVTEHRKAGYRAFFSRLLGLRQDAVVAAAATLSPAAPASAATGLPRQHP